MTVYVDDMHRRPHGRLGRSKMSHMIADGIGFEGATVSNPYTRMAELSAMARAIGLKREWRHGDHYDVPLFRRAYALARGAVEITERQCAAMSAITRRTGVMPKPEAAERLFAAYVAGVAQHLDGMRRVSSAPVAPPALPAASNETANPTQKDLPSSMEILVDDFSTPESERGSR